MSNLTFEEINLLCIYDGGSRQKTVAALKEMRGVLTDEDQELRELTDSALEKLGSMTEDEYSKLELYPVFDLMPISNSGHFCPEFEITGHPNSIN